MPKLATTMLTDVMVRNLKAKGTGRLEVRDSAVRGLGLRVNGSTSKTWFVMKRVKGKQARITLGRYPATSLSEARGAAAEIIRSIASGKSPSASQGLTVADLFEQWLDQHQCHKKGGKEAARAMRKHVLPLLGHHPLETVRRYEISQAIVSIRATHKLGAHVNRLLSYTKSMLNWAVKQGHLDANPAAMIPKPVAEKSREKVLTPHELRGLWKAAEGLHYPFGPFFQLLLLTGQRRGEVAGMQWDEIDLVGRTWSLPGSRTKNGRPHVVPLSLEAVRILQDLEARLKRLDKQPVGLVFSETGARPISGFSKAKKRFDRAAGLTEWRLHDFRRSFATQAAEHLDTAPVVIELHLNHASGLRAGVAGIYDRSQQMEKRTALMAAWSEFILQIGNDEEPAKAESPGTRRGTSALPSQSLEIAKSVHTIVTTMKV